jgi:beta-1,4-mannosyltransferase
MIKSDQDLHLQSEAQTNPGNSCDGSCYVLRRDRPALLVSSTSWTADEDFSILLHALRTYNQHVATQKQLPNILLIVTGFACRLCDCLMLVSSYAGKGPLKQHFESIMATMNEECQHVQCITLWLPPSDYPLLLGSSDIGISLHYSSSGLDLPMKVVDMFGACLPVLAINFNWYIQFTLIVDVDWEIIFFSLPELVEDGKTGFLFHDANTLANHLEVVMNCCLSSLISLYVSDAIGWLS